MTGLKAMEDLIEQITVRRDRSSDHSALRKLEAVLDVLESVGEWFRYEPKGARTERMRVVLEELRWTSAEALVGASTEQLDAGLLRLLHVLLESPQVAGSDGPTVSPSRTLSSEATR